MGELTMREGGERDVANVCSTRHMLRTGTYIAPLSCFDKTAHVRQALGGLINAPVIAGAITVLIRSWEYDV